MPGIISGIGGTIVAAVATRSSFEANGDTNRYKLQLSWLIDIIKKCNHQINSYRLFTFYPSRIPPINSTDYNSFNLSATIYKDGGDGRSASVQAGYQIAALGLTLGKTIRIYYYFFFKFKYWSFNIIILK